VTDRLLARAGRAVPLRRVVPNRVARWFTPELVRMIRWTAVGVWAVIFADDMYVHGIPYYRSDLLLWLSIGLVAASIGKRNVLTVVLDFVPFAAVLIGYDYLRGISDSLGMPTWWHPQLDVDKWLFLGREPTVWLQERLLYPDVQWWDVLASLCYVSFFFLPYVTAAVLWLRSRRDFYQWSLRFVALSFIGFTWFAVIPAAPPWAAARCTAAEVAGHPYDPTCIGFPEGARAHNLLGRVAPSHPDVGPWVHRTVGRGFSELHLTFAGAVIKAGQGGVDLVAAVPSLHAGGIMLFAIFFWRRLNRRWRPLLVAYPILMAFSLVYTAEHYLSDVLAGWLAAALACLAAARIERRRSAVASPDTLDAPTEKTVENPCPPTEVPAQPPATTRSST
jgi:membrane-associated phospholipid phosphatase